MLAHGVFAIYLGIVSIAGVHVGPEMPGPDVVGMLAKAGNAVEIEIECVARSSGSSTLSALSRMLALPDRQALQLSLLCLECLH